jgi:type III secretion system outer membrane ring protein
MMKIQKIAVVASILAFSGAVFAQTPLEGTTITRQSDIQNEQGFVSRGDSVSLVLDALGARKHLSVIVSSLAQKKKVSGDFDLGQPDKVLEWLQEKLGLVSYSDGQSLYIYDATEMRNAVGHMQFASIATLRDFLVKAQLADDRYPVRGGSSGGTFYVSGPPVYVNIVVDAARYLDKLYAGADINTQMIEVIKLENSFVTGRRYGVRGAERDLPGVADILQAALGREGVVSVIRQLEGTETDLGPDKKNSTDVSRKPIQPIGKYEEVDSGTTLILAYPETNSLLVRGTMAQIQKVKNLVAEIDLSRKQIELSLWIIDVRKDQLDRLGAAWGGEVGIGNKFGASINQGGAVTTLDGQRFLAAISALAKKGDASVVSRPAILTQENVMAHFDAGNSFYTPLVGERSSSLETITYGTMIGVLPRVSSNNDIEMQLKIEDGAASTAGQGVGGLPIVSRINIDTVARVPQDLSLLVGGYTREQQEETRTRIPGLSRLPFIGGAFRYRSKRVDSLARVFLIQPRLANDFPLSKAAEVVEKFEREAVLPLPERYRQQWDEKDPQEQAPRNGTIVPMDSKGAAMNPATPGDGTQALSRPRPAGSLMPPVSWQKPSSRS